MVLIQSLLNVLQYGLVIVDGILWIWALSTMTGFYVPMITEFMPKSSNSLLLLTVILTVVLLLTWSIREYLGRNDHL